MRAPAIRQVGKAGKTVTGFVWGVPQSIGRKDKVGSLKLEA